MPKPSRTLLAPLASVLDGTPGSALFGFAKHLGAPTTLRQLGMAEADLDRAAKLATARPHPNPWPIDADAIRALLRAA